MVQYILQACELEFLMNISFQRSKIPEGKKAAQEQKNHSSRSNGIIYALHIFSIYNVFGQTGTKKIKKKHKLNMMTGL